MKLKKWIQIVLIGSSILTLVACTHKTPTNPSAIYEANNSYNGNSRPMGPRVSGLGQETTFGDQGMGKGRALAKRVYYFDFDSNVVHDQDKPAIIANSNTLSSHPAAKVMLEGHTDPRGSREYNIGLGERRAKAVGSILTAQGANPNQISVVSYGAEKLAAKGHTESDYQLDRRAVLVYVKR